MQMVSDAYKRAMKDSFRGRTFVSATVGVVNQEAQKSAEVAQSEKCTYFSDLRKPFENYTAIECYATCEQDYAAVDGTMFFLPRQRRDVVLNQGIVTEELLGSIEICFPKAVDIRGLTLEFGATYPVDFSIVADSGTVTVTGNSSERYITDEIFTGVTYLRIVPESMSNGQGRLHLHGITMGTGIYFDNKRLKSLVKHEYISPIMAELPTIDVTVTVENRNREFDIENVESAVNFLEIGQSVSIRYGLELEDGTTEWLPGGNLVLREWSADDEVMTFTASDRFDDMNGIYQKGRFYSNGISLYDLALDVLADAEVDSRGYWIDPYLKGVLVNNPMPVVTHKEALQLIANAGRCVLYQDSEGVITIKSSFVPEISVNSDDAAYYSRVEDILDGSKKAEYAVTGQNASTVDGMQGFLPREGEFMNVGYVSESLADAEGNFVTAPFITMLPEAAYKCFGLTLEFGGNQPKEVCFMAYLSGELKEEYLVQISDKTVVISHEFPEFDCLLLKFTKGSPNNRVNLQNLFLGERTDYTLTYGAELTKTPKGIQLSKVKEVQVIRNLYTPEANVKELAKEIISKDGTYVFTFGSPVYNLSCNAAGAEVTIIEQGCYYAAIEVSGSMGAFELVVSGKEYAVSQAKVSYGVGDAGQIKEWNNPLISDSDHAVDVAEWLGMYFASDREYELQYRGEPRLAGNDLAYLENRYVTDMMIQIYEHMLNFNGALSGTIKARRVVDVANT